MNKIERMELLNCDCMEYMSTIKDNSFDLGIVDPPYGLKVNVKDRVFKGGKAKRKHYKAFTGNGIDGAPPKEYFIELSRVCKNYIIWGANHFADNMLSAQSPCWIVWDKENGKNDFADCEVAYASFQTSIRIFRFRWQGMLQGDMKNKEKRIHPTQKPVVLYNFLLQNYAKPGQRILDTHLGSGSSAIAAHYFGVNFVGCEIDKGYYDMASERILKETRQATFI